MTKNEGLFQSSYLGDWHRAKRHFYLAVPEIVGVRVAAFNLNGDASIVLMRHLAMSMGMHMFMEMNFLVQLDAAILHGIGLVGGCG